ncbi:hypothetical protein LP415_09470 [Polaromonas sp. P1(28)-8]|nr:hypothetical protein LP415_09470 [Polaromonas sp. P1(28)-8]
MTTPNRTVQILGELRRLGFDDLAFSHLHHWRAVGRIDTIDAHAKYCAERQYFLEGGTNEKVQQRLELVLRAYTQGGFVSGRQEVFVALAEAAWFELPHVSSLHDER